MVTRTVGRHIVVLALAGALLLASTVVVSAVTTPGWASWEPLSGSSGGYTTTMQLPAGGFPAASVTSDSRRGQVGVQSGGSIWLGEATPPGAVFGGSQDQPYLNLRPRADTSTVPLTTTYTFERPAPPGSWAFVLGDIDADRAVVIARGSDGQLLTGAELGWQGGFNYCAVTPSPSCTGDSGDIATWDPVTGEVIGNAAGIDTSGASGWFMPTVPVTSLTIYFFQRSGFPVYQTWFASLARDVSGTVVHDTEGPIGDATLTLFGPDGTALATTTSAGDGTYSFPGYAAADGYTVEMRPPAPPPGGPGYIAVGTFRLPADLSETDATGVDFLLRDIVPVPVSGVVTTTDGTPVPGATVTLTDSDGTERSAVSDSTGAYVIDDVPVGDHSFTVVPPDGYGVLSVPEPLTVPPGSEEPITDQDVVLQQQASVSGAVTAGGAPVPGAVVTITGPGGTASTGTAADGSYSFDLLPPGDYTVTLEVPFGYTADGPSVREVTVGTDDVTGVDFALHRPGSIGGIVTDTAGDPVPGVTITVGGPDGSADVVTGPDGAYYLGQLPAGGYTITMTVPEGYTAGITERSTTITAAGENRLDEDFLLTPVVAPVSADGTVATSDGTGVPGAVVTVRDAAGTVVGTVTTGDDGSWGLDLPPGPDYTAEVAPPSGYEVDGDAVIAFDVADEPVTGLDFLLRAVPAPPPSEPPPSETPTAAPTTPGTGPPGARPMPESGAPVAGLAVAALLLMLGGAGLAVVGRRRRGRR